MPILSSLKHAELRIYLFWWLHGHSHFVLEQSVNLIKLFIFRIEKWYIGSRVIYEQVIKYLHRCSTSE